MDRSGIRIRLFLGLIAAAFALFSYYTKSQVNPITGEKQHISISPEQEIAMGLNSAPSMAAEFGGLYEDEKVQNAIKKIGQRLVQSTDAAKSPYQFDFHVLADPETVNAFALPGGQVFITVGLLKRLGSEDEIAGVLGHEIGHVIGRHSAEQIAQQELTQGLVNATQIATYDPHSPNGTAQMAAFVGNMVSMKFSRSDELEADHFGVLYMYQSGYDPENLIKVMEVLEQVSAGAPRNEFMSSHPSPANRMVEIRKAIDALKGQAQ